MGQPVLTDVFHAADMPEKTLLQMAASLEKLSEHPLGKAIVEAAEAQKIPLLSVSDFQQIPGQGIRGKIDGQVCLAGNQKLMEASGIDHHALDEWQNTMADAGKNAAVLRRWRTACGHGGCGGCGETHQQAGH